MSAGESSPRFGRIRDMIRTFWERWWITNRLYHFSFGRGPVWVSEEDFVRFLMNAVQEIDGVPVQGNRLSPWWILQPSYEIRVRNLIKECSDTREGIPTVTRDDEREAAYVRLSYRGRETYSVSYLVFGCFFGNYYFKWLFGIAMTYLIARYLGASV